MKQTPEAFYSEGVFFVQVRFFVNHLTKGAILMIKYPQVKR